jgi:CheY-like chemotaxis protein
MTPKETSFAREMDRGLVPTDTLPLLVVPLFHLCRGLACYVPTENGARGRSTDQWHTGCTTTDRMKSPGTPAKRVLLISSDRDLRRQLHACLSAAGITTAALTTVRNGNECLAALTKIRPRLIVLDDSTTHLNGPGLLHALHQHAPGALVVYLTISHSLELERTVRQSGVLYYTEKPPDSPLLTKLLAAVFAPLPETRWRHTPTATYTTSRR